MSMPALLWHCGTTRSMQTASYCERSPLLRPCIARSVFSPAVGSRLLRSPLAAGLAGKVVVSPKLRALGSEDDKKGITREEEPDQFWQSEAEKQGKSPAQDPLAIIGILGLLIPFIILGIAIATGTVDVNAGSRPIAESLP